MQILSVHSVSLKSINLADVAEVFSFVTYYEIE